MKGNSYKKEQGVPFQTPAGRRKGLKKKNKLAGSRGPRRRERRSKISKSFD